MNYNYELEFHYKDENQDPIYLTHTFPGMDSELYAFIKSEFSDDIDSMSSCHMSDCHDILS